MKPTPLIGFGDGDADAFYASAEAVRRPWLAKLPVGVLGNQGACVIARSYSMKKFGVKVGESIWEAKSKCPDGVYVKRDFRWYETLSRKMLAEVRENFSPAVEYYSIDEFFWSGDRTHATYQQTAEAVRAHILERVGVPMTVATPAPGPWRSCSPTPPSRSGRSRSRARITSASCWRSCR